MITSLARRVVIRRSSAIPSFGTISNYFHTQPQQFQHTQAKEQSQLKSSVPEEVQAWMDDMEDYDKRIISYLPGSSLQERIGQLGVHVQAWVDDMEDYDKRIISYLPGSSLQERIGQQN